jgi:hypothetical protein
MVFLLVGFCAGLIVGWNVLPQPEFVKRWYAAALERFKN